MLRDNLYFAVLWDSEYTSQQAGKIKLSVTRRWPSPVVTHTHTHTPGEMPATCIQWICWLGVPTTVSRTIHFPLALNYRWETGIKANRKIQNPLTHFGGEGLWFPLQHTRWNLLALLPRVSRSLACWRWGPLGAPFLQGTLWPSWRHHKGIHFLTLAYVMNTFK